MAGPQFIHLEGYARKTSKQSKTKTTDIDGVIGEALREAGYHSHIENPEAPKPLFGTLDNLAAIRDEIAAKIDQEKDPRGRKIRSDKNILLAGVTSYAKPLAALKDASPDEKQEFETWKDLTISFLKKEFGDNLRCVIEHFDEEYPHLHFYVLDKNKVSETMDLHPGFNAKYLADQTSRRDKDKAYREAMSVWQDKYHTEVASYCGLTRLGPKVQRLNRQEWKARKQEASLLADLRNQIDQEYDDLQADLDQFEAEKKQFDRKVKRRISAGMQAIRDKYDQGMKTLVSVHDELKAEKRRISQQYPDVWLGKITREEHAEEMIEAYEEAKQEAKSRKASTGMKLTPPKPWEA